MKYPKINKAAKVTLTIGDEPKIHIPCIDANSVTLGMMNRIMALPHSNGPDNISKLAIEQFNTTCFPKMEYIHGELVGKIISTDNRITARLLQLGAKLLPEKYMMPLSLERSIVSL